MCQEGEGREKRVKEEACIITIGVIVSPNELHLVWIDALVDLFDPHFPCTYVLAM